MIGLGGEEVSNVSKFLSNHQDRDNSLEIRIQKSSGSLDFVGTPGNSSKTVYQVGRTVKNGN